MVTLNNEIEALENAIKRIDNRLKHFRVLKLSIPNKDGNKNIVAYFRKSKHGSARAYELKNDDAIDEQIEILEKEKQEILQSLERLKHYCE